MASVVSLARLVHNESFVRFAPVPFNFDPIRAGDLPLVPVSQTFRDWVREQLAPSVPGLHDRRMFGAVGIYAGEFFFALLDNDRLYLKVDDTNRADFTTAGMGPFQPFGDDRMTMQYYEVPLEVIEKPAELASWAEKAIAVARTAATRKPKKPTKKLAKANAKSRSAAAPKKRT